MPWLTLDQATAIVDAVERAGLVADSGSMA
jgi:hypothetical protein